MQALGINPGNLFISIIFFLIAYLIIRKLIYNPIQKMIEARKEVIDGGLADAKKAAELRDQAEKEYAEKIAAANAKSADILKDATDQVSKMKTDYRRSIDEEARKELQDSREYLQKERELMINNLRGQIIDLSISGAKKIIGEDLKISEETQRKILQDSFTGIRNQSIADISSFPDGLKDIEVTTAIPLTEDEKKIVYDLIHEKLDGPRTPSFLVDPKILGGMIIRSGDYLIDGSVLGRARGLKEALHK